MARSILVGWLLVTLFGSMSFAHGQKATERYIPIGQSPGQSGKYTILGTVQAVDAAGRAFTVAAPAGAQKITVTDRTDIWIDRTSQKLTTLRGSFADLQTGRRVEVKYADEKRKDLAEWVKVEARAATP